MDRLADKKHALSLSCVLRCFTLQIVRIPNYSSSPGLYVCFSSYHPNMNTPFGEGTGEGLVRGNTGDLGGWGGDMEGTNKSKRVRNKIGSLT